MKTLHSKNRAKVGKVLMTHEPLPYTLAGTVAQPGANNCGNPHATNYFSHTCSSNIYDFYNATANATTIVYNSSNNLEPYCSLNVTANNCPLPITSCTGWCSYCAVGPAISSELSFKASADAAANTINSGNAAKLYTDISLMLTPAQLQDSLLKPGPYLSDGVMNAAIALDLPFDTLRNILVPNAPLSPGVISTFTASGYYTGPEEAEITGISGTSARTQLVQDTMFFFNEAGIYTNAIIIYYLNDSIAGNIDSAIASFYRAGLPNNQLVMLAALQAQKGDTTDAMSTIATIYGTGDTVYTNYCIIMPKLIRLSYKPNGFYALKNEPADSAIFNTIAMDTNKPGYEEARVVLNLVYNLQFAEQIFPLGTGGGHHPTQHVNAQNNTGSSQLSTFNSQFNLYPNPANNSLTIQYQLPGNSSEANIIIYDVLGNKVVNWVLPLSQNIITGNVSKLSDGIYFYTINIDNAVAKRGKVTIAR